MINGDKPEPAGFRMVTQVLILLILMAGFGASTRADSQITWTASPPIISASEISYPPFCVVDEDGQADGFSVELMRAALAAMDRDVSFRVGTWNEARGWLEKGEVQALPIVGHTQERESLYDFTFPYMSLHGAIVVRKGTSGISTLIDLRGKRVAVMEGDNAEEFLRRENRGIEIHTTPTFETALSELSEGFHDAVVIQRLVALRLIQESGLSNLEVINKPIPGLQQDFCFAVQEGDRDTLALLNEGLALVTADGTYNRLHTKWFAALELPTNRRILIGGDNNYPPFEYLDKDGRPTGYNVDLTRAIAREMGLDVEIRLGPWNEILKDLEMGEIDAVQGMLYSRERDLRFDFTQPHTMNHYVSVARKNEGSPPATLKELIGKDVVVERGDIMNDFLAENGLGERLSTSISQETALRELTAGQHDCALVARITALYCIEKYGWDNLVIGKDEILSPEYCFAVLKNNRSLLTQFSEGLKLLEETGEYRRIYNKWMGVYEEKTPDLAAIFRYLLMVAIPLLLALLGFLLWSWSLRKQVAARTEELNNVSERYQAILLAVPEIVMEVDSNKIYTWANAAGLEFFGNDVIGREAAEYFIGEQDLYDRLQPLFNGKENVFYIESRQRRKDGQERLLGWWCRALKDSSGQVSGALSTARDITESKRAEEALRESEARFRLLYEQSPGPYQSLDADGCILEVNNAWLEALGYKYQEVLGRWFGEFLTGLGPEQFKEKFILFKRLGEIHGIEFEMKRKDGTSIIVSFDGRISRDGQGRFLQANSVLTNLTEYLRLQNQLSQAQKMESVGRLAGGVAHDYNNMLSVIMGYSELAIEKIDPDNSLHSDLTEILTAARRSSEITRQLLAFSRRQTISPMVLNLNETVESMLKMLRQLIGEDIDLTWLPGTDVWPVRMDPVQVNQILANLCVNARDAIEGVGKITIETEKVSIDDAYCGNHPGFSPGDYVSMTVSDNGCGMDQETLSSIFEPFFTTKEMQRGTGLGLATTYGIVKQNKGFINVYSEPGQGTTFKIFLPRHLGMIKEVKLEPSGEILPGHGETILLVEDEPEIMKMAETMLGKLNYQVLAANTPGEAILLAGEQAGAIDLLLTDLVMPEMNGRNLSEKLQSLYPGFKTLFMSGYTANVVAHHGILEEGINFIQKPFSMKGLSSKIREVLDN